MNDYSEIEYGAELLENALKAAPGDELKAAMEKVSPRWPDHVLQVFRGWLPTLRSNTYLTCISEHEADEDDHGRLSMWRAYGGHTGVAMVMNPSPFLTDSNALGAWSSPVAYLRQDGMNHEMKKVARSISDNSDFLRTLSHHTLFAYAFRLFRAAVLSTKHPGFHEEREWRVIYSPQYEGSKRIQTVMKSIRGTPQMVCLIPLHDVPEEGLTGLALPEFLDRLIIGPTRFPEEMHEAFVHLLKAEGAGQLTDRVVISNIPLRRAID
jgi:hypothetical protein